MHVKKPHLMLLMLSAKLLLSKWAAGLSDLITVILRKLIQTRAKKFLQLKYQMLIARLEFAACA